MNITASLDTEPADTSIEETIDPLPQKEPEKTILQQGKTLRLLAQDLFGNREFWIYIYLENKDKISNPNKVQSGIELDIPDRSVYAIDAADPLSVGRAKTLGDQALEQFKK